MSEQTITRSQFIMIAENRPDMLPLMQVALQDGRLEVVEDDE